MKRGRLEIMLLFGLLFSSISAYAQGVFTPAFDLFRSLDPINVIYRLMQPLVDFTVVFAIFYSISRIVYVNQYKTEEKIKPLIVGVGIALSGSFVWFLQSKGWTLFSLLGNFSFLLVFILLGLFLFHMFKTQGAFEKDTGQRIAIFVLIVLVLFKSLLGVPAWNAVLPPPILGFIDIVIAIGLLVCLVSFFMWFIPKLSISGGKKDEHASTHPAPQATTPTTAQATPVAHATPQPLAQSPDQIEATRQANVHLSAHVQGIASIVEEIRQLALQMETDPDPARVKATFDVTDKRLHQAMQRFTEHFRRIHDLHIRTDDSLKKDFVEIMGKYFAFQTVFEQHARNRGVM